MDSSPLLHALERFGPLPAKRLQQLTGMSQSSFQRATRDQAEHLIRVGKARATRWAARRHIKGLLTPIPIYEVDTSGGVALLATLHPVAPFGHAVVPASAEASASFVEADPGQLAAANSLDIPWFLQDKKPEGYMGRAWLSQHAELGYPPSLARWTGDDVLRYLAHHGEQAPGALLVGALAKVHFEQARFVAPLSAHDVERVYSQRAHSEAFGTPLGSSAGGEQPKFTARIEGHDSEIHDVIVKFSAPVSTPPGRRWADLLIAEHVAHEVLVRAAVPSCSSRVLNVHERCFLEVRRFDRHGERGRSGVVSLHPFDPEGVASGLRSWSLVTAQLADAGRLSREDHATVQWIEAFGHLIANTDMHLGNLSLTHRGGRLTGLAPVYDMLPMFHAPRATGEVVDRLYNPWQAIETAPDSAVAAARGFWRELTTRADLSERFRALAAAQLSLI